MSTYAWIEPKTDWEPLDYINKEDINRIINNIYYLRQQAIAHFDIDDYVAMQEKTSYADMIFATEINTIEDNLEKLAVGLNNLDIGQKQHYSANGNGFDYEELNRIESACFTCYFYIRTRPERHFTWNFGRLGMFN